MTTTGQQGEIEALIRENRRRYEQLRAHYNPVTGENAPGERVKLEISDFATPVMYVPVDMMKVKLIRLLQKYGSIQAMLLKHPFENPQTFRGIERQIRRIRHQYDFVYWAFFEIRILDKEGGGIIRFKLNYAQIVVLEKCEELRRAGKPINIIICKARQWGGSTFCFFYQTWIALKWRDTHAFSICAQTNGVAKSIKDMLTFAFEKYQAWDLELPDNESLKLVNGGEGNEYVIKDSKGNIIRNNKIRIGSIIAPDNLRGLPGSGAHFSEVGVWPDTPGRRPEDLIKSITGGILPRAYTMQAIESTPKGSGNYFHREYMRAKNGKSSFHAIFIPWFYIPHDTLSIDDEEAFAKWLLSCRGMSVAPDGYSDPGKYYWHLWEIGATFQGINWYRIKRKEYDDFADMASEAPSDDIEAFQHSGTKVFNIYDIYTLQKDCKSPLMKGSLQSDSDRGKEVLRNIRFVPQTDGNLWIWEEPDDSPVKDRYLTVVDVGGRGKDADWSVIRVFDRFPMIYDGHPTLVAQMRYHTDHDLLAYDAMRIASWYGNSLLVIESNTLETKDQERDTDGNMIEYILDKIAGIYPNLYFRRGSEENIEEGKPVKWGFHTNTATKPKIIGHLVECVRDHLWVERDSYCCDELAIYEKNNKNQFSAPPGKGNHDDVLMATAIGLWVCYREMDMPKWVDEKTFNFDRSIDEHSASQF